MYLTLIRKWKLSEDIKEFWKVSLCKYPIKAKVVKLLKKPNLEFSLRIINSKENCK